MADTDRDSLFSNRDSSFDYGRESEEATNAISKQFLKIAQPEKNREKVTSSSSALSKANISIQEGISKLGGNVKEAFTSNNTSAISNYGKIIKDKIVSNISFLPVAFVVIILIILILIVLSVMYPSSVKSTTSDDSINKQSTIRDNITAFIVITCILLFASIVIFFVPSFQEIKRLIGELRGIILIMIYLVFLLILFRSIIPADVLYTYSKILLPVTLLPGAYLFYKEITSKPPGSRTDLNYERIKYSLLYFCLIVFILIFYTCDPGGYIKQYFGPNLVFTILLLVFGLLYLLTLMVPAKYLYPSKDYPSTSASPEASGFFKGFTWIGGFNVFCFIFFLVLASYGIYNFPDETPSTKNGIIAGTIIVFLIWIPLIFYTLFPVAEGSTTVIESAFSNYRTLFQRVLLVIFGLLFSSMLIYLIVSSSKSLTNSSGVASFILNLIIVIACLGILFKIISSTETYQKSHIFKLIVNIVLYIPCILVVIIDKLIDIIGYGRPSIPDGKLGMSKTREALSYGFNKSKEALTEGVNNIKNTQSTYFILLLVILMAYFIYFAQPYISDYFAKQGGTPLINQPIYLNQLQTLGTSQDLNQSTNFDYTYGISFWFFLHEHGPNTNASYNTYTSLLNYGGKPNILYDASNNTIMVTMLNTTGQIGQDITNYDQNGNFIIYTRPNILLQKWNNMIINYNGGTMDIFFNGELVKSFENIVPLMSYDVLTTGFDDGIDGGICNVTYFNKSLTSSQLYYLYHLVKDKTPPVTFSDDTTIQQINKYTAPISTGFDSSSSNTSSSIKNSLSEVGSNIQTSISNFFLKK